MSCKIGEQITQRINNLKLPLFPQPALTEIVSNNNQDSIEGISHTRRLIRDFLVKDLDPPQLMETYPPKGDHL